MNTASFLTLAQDNHWSVLWPELSLVVLALVLLLLEVFLPAARHRWIPQVAIAGQFLLLVLGCLFFEPMTAPAFNGMLEHGELATLYKPFFLVCSLFVSCMAAVYFGKQSLSRVEFYAIVLLVTAAFMVLVDSRHFILFYVALETVTVGFFVLVAYCRTSTASLEAGLKYLVMGALSSAVLLFGIVLLYGVSGNPALPEYQTEGLGFVALGHFIAANPDNALVLVGAMMVLAGVAFKIGIVPFQFWVPDVYQGAPTPVTAFLAVASKAAGFMVLLNLILGPFAALASVLLPVVVVGAAATVLFGNLAALGQHDVKRLMGLSGIAHAGYMLMAVAAMLQGVTWAMPALFFYLFTYLLGSFAVFGVMTHVAGRTDERQEMEDYENLFRTQPFLAGVLAFGLGSLAGIPPLAGFMGKLFLFVAVYQAGLYGLLAVAVLGVVLSIYYYFGWLREVFFRTARMESPDEEEELREPSSLQKVVLGVVAVLIVLIGCYQGFIGSFMATS